MDKEQELLDMAKIICKREFSGYNLDCEKNCDGKCSCGKIAEDLYNSGYHKTNKD